MKRVYLLDGTNLLYRAYHAIRPFTTASGLTTHAVYGIISMVLKLEREERPDLVAAVFDPRGPTLKHELYEDYKANRERTPEDLVEQIPYVHKVLKAMGLPVLVVDGVEADDVIGTLATKLSEEGDEVTIVTGDKDFCQLVSERIRLLDTMKDRFTKVEDVPERMGVSAERVIDLLAIMGDKVDNLPGVPGIGPKGAAKLLADYGSIEGIIEHADEVKGKRGEALREHIDRIRKNVPLVTIERELDLPIAEKDLTPRERNREAMAALFRELEFKRFLRELDLENVKPSTHEKEQALARASSGTNPSLPLGEIEESSAAKIPADWIAAVEGEGGIILLNANGASAAPLKAGATIVGHGLKGLRESWATAGIPYSGPFFDTRVAAYLLNPGQRDYELEDLARDRGIELGGGEGVLTLAAAMKAELDIAGMGKLSEEIEMPLVGALARMEAQGVLVDSGKLAELSSEYEGRIEDLAEKMYSLAGGEFNPNSPKQLSEILFEKRGLTPLRKTATGAWSTDASVLEELALVDELPALVIDYRGLTKLKNSFIDTLPKLVDERDGRIHATFHQIIAATGRLSSSNPNLQNIPVRGEEGRRIREAFIAPEGYTLLSADYSQVELRLVAHMSADPTLLELFASGRDIHSETAARLFDVGPLGVTSEMRRQAKTVNFGIIYGISPFGLARQLGVPQQEAKRMIDTYFKRFPGVRSLTERFVEEGSSLGYSLTLFGRRRPLRELASRNRNEREFGKRMAFNSPIQGTAADIIKRAMLDAVAAMDNADLDAELILQVHDELVFEVRDEALEEARALLVEAMESAAELRVPLLVEAGDGKDWFSAHGG
ncbi:MAG: DNA polymerase I [Deltaproteobacteria bacterium]|nr:MAG: DNA polymerase I [Deltaproteobacteria bacterium]